MNNYPRKLTARFSESANDSNRTILDMRKFYRESVAGVSSGDTADCLNAQYDSIKYCADNCAPLRNGDNDMGILENMRKTLSNAPSTNNHRKEESKQ